MNHITLMGRLTRDPELRSTQSGTAVASFTLAVDRAFRSRESGERQTDFIDVVAWREKGEFVSKYFVKGQMCAVAGRLEIREWQDRDGNKRRSYEVVADSIYFTDSKKSREGSFGGSYSAERSMERPASPAPGFTPEPRREFDPGFSVPGSDFSELESDDGDLPF